MILLTTSPSSVGFKDFCSFITYSRASIVEIIEAYVEGLPMPSSSRDLINDASVYLAGGSVKCCPELISFNFKNTDCVTLSNYLSEKHKIMIRSGLHCAPIAHKTIGTFESGTARLSLSYFNTFEEVDMFLEIIDKKRFI